MVHRLSSMRLIVRLEIENTGSIFSYIATAIGASGGDIVAVDLIQSRRDVVVRDITIQVENRAHGDRHRPGPGGAARRQGGQRLGPGVPGAPRRQDRGEAQGAGEDPRRPLAWSTRPGVADVCRAIAEDPDKAFTLTIKRNTVAVVTDGTAVLGLGDIGPAAALPVMEGKAMLFKEFAGVDAFPICLDTKDPDEIVAHREGHRPGLRRHQPGGHLRAPLLRNRGAAEGGAGHPRLPRRPARHRRGGAGRR